MKHFPVAVFGMLLLAGCGRQGQDGAAPDKPGAGPPDKTKTLAEARQGFRTKVVRKEPPAGPLPNPPPQLFRKVQFDSAVGKIGTYLTPDPKDGKKHPAIIWITGGDCNSVGNVWSPAPPSNDQTAAAYRKAGIVMMFPT